jgi:oligopeptidase A
MPDRSRTLESENPLLNQTDIPLFNAIRAEHIQPALEQIISDNRAAIEILIQKDKADWDNFVQPFEDLDERLSRMWDAASHLNSVLDDEAFRDSYRTCLPLISDYATDIAQDERIYSLFQQVHDSPSVTSLTIAQQKIIDNALRDFRLSGVSLPTDRKERFKVIQSELSTLNNRFDQNLLDATDAYSLRIEDKVSLKGLPDTALAQAREEASNRDLDGWVFTLKAPSYVPFIMFCEDRDLRRQMYEAFVTRASDVGPFPEQWDNAPVIDETLALRRESAGLLDFEDYVAYALETRMAKNSDEVLDFLYKLAGQSRPAALKEFDELQQFASEQGSPDLSAWDVPYWSEKLRQQKYAISQEDLRPWFPLDKVLQGLFDVAQRLYGLDVRQQKDVPVWHEDVRFYVITDQEGECRGRFFLDLYARKGKRGGAWMGDGISRKRLDGSVQAPLAWLVTNFSPPLGDQPSLLTHDEVITLFHEFGHGLHHMLTQIDFPAVAGINGVPWDAVELPSQMMENWCWQDEVLEMISGHIDTGEPLPKDMVARLQAARDFQAGMQLIRQLEFSLFDMRIHLAKDATPVQQILDDVRSEVAVILPPDFNRFQNGFSHIFAGGYASGYYSYSWAEVLSADAFSLFEENGIFDRKTGHAFMENILEKGGSQEPMDLFVAFRGREPEIDAFLRHRGLAA